MLYDGLIELGIPMTYLLSHSILLVLWIIKQNISFFLSIHLKNTRDIRLYNIDVTNKNSGVLKIFLRFYGDANIIFYK